MIFVIVVETSERCFWSSWCLYLDLSGMLSSATGILRRSTDTPSFHLILEMFFSSVPPYLAYLGELVPSWLGRACFLCLGTKYRLPLFLCLLHPLGLVPLQRGWLQLTTRNGFWRQSGSPDCHGPYRGDRSHQNLANQWMFQQQRGSGYSHIVKGVVFSWSADIDHAGGS